MSELKTAFSSHTACQHVFPAYSLPHRPGVGKTYVGALMREHLSARHSGPRL